MISIVSDSIMAEKKFPFSTHRSRKIEKFVQFTQKKEAFCDTIQEDSTGGRNNGKYTSSHSRHHHFRHGFRRTGKRTAARKQFLYHRANGTSLPGKGNQYHQHRHGCTPADYQHPVRPNRTAQRNQLQGNLFQRIRCKKRDNTPPCRPSSVVRGRFISVLFILNQAIRRMITPMR